MDKKKRMYILLSHIRKVTALAALGTSLTLLAACSSGSDPVADPGTTPDNVGSDLATDTGTTPPDNDGGTPTPADGASGPEAAVMGGWVLCNEIGGIRVEYEFTATTYANRVGAGTCAGFDAADQVLENAGPYAITGTTTSDSGLASSTMELTTETINGAPVFDSLIEKRFRLVYTGTPNQLVFSDDTFEGEDISLTLNLETPYVRFR